MIPRILLTAALAAFAAEAGAQTSYPTPFDLGRAQDIAARPMALGGSYTAVASDASALYYNPAGLSAVKKHELSLSLDRTVLSGIDRADGYPSRTSSQEALRIQSLNWLLPIPTVRGGLTFAFGYYSPRTFSDVISYEDGLAASRGAYDYRADGGMGDFRGGMGIDLAPDLSFGLALGYVSGSEEIRVIDGSESGYLRTYSGFNLEPSLMFKISPRLRAGASLVLWEKFWNLEEVYEEKGIGNSEENYQVRNPFQFKSGLAYQGNSFLVSADARLNAWSQYRYGNADASTLERTGYKDELILSLGAEKFLPVANTMLRAGYTLNTLPETAFDATYDLHRFSVGAGFLISGSLSLDLAYSYSFWGLAGDGLTLDNREHRGLLTMAYRY